MFKQNRFKALLFGLSGLLITGSMYNCEIINEGNTPFAVQGRYDTQTADETTQTDDGSGNTLITDRWTNVENLNKKATVLLMMDTSGSLNDDRDDLLTHGIPAIVNNFASEFETCFAVAGAYINYPYNWDTVPGTSNPAISNANYANGTFGKLADPSGKILPAEDLDAACLCLSDFSNTDDLISALKANIDLAGDQTIGSGEAMVKSMHELFTNPDLMNPIVSAGKCFQEDHSVVAITISDETDFTICPSDQDISQDAFYSSSNWSQWGIGTAGGALPNTSYTFDVSPECGEKDVTIVNPAVDCHYAGSGSSSPEVFDYACQLSFASEIIGATMFSTFESPTGKWKMHNTIDTVASEMKAFLGSLPFFMAVVGFDSYDAVRVVNDNNKANEEPAIAEIALSKKFSSGDAYHVPFEHLRTDNIPAFSAAFEDLSEELRQDASYLTVFDTQPRCPGTTKVLVDGVELIPVVQYEETTTERVTIIAPFHRGTNVEVEYTLDFGPNC